MQLEAQSLPGVFLLRPERQPDARGFFARVFDAAVLEAAGLETHFPERAVAANDRAGTLRGVHFAESPHAEAKIVRCLLGEIFDVAVDLRPRAPTYGKWFAIRLRADDLVSIYIPRGFGHGYQALVDGTIVSYDLSTPYVADAARGVRYDDPDLAIPWPLAVSVISPRDAGLPNLRAIAATSR